MDAENEQRKVRRDLVEVETKLMAFEDLSEEEGQQPRNSEKGGCQIA